MFTIAMFLGKFAIPVVLMYFLMKMAVGVTMNWQAKMDSYFIMMGY